MRPDNLSQSLAINPATTDLPRGTRPEPSFGSRPLLVEFDEPAPDKNKEARFDLKEAAATPAPMADERRPPPLSQQTRGQSLASWAMAVGVYVVTLLVLLPWDFEPAPVTPPIPVQLVIEEPPPPPPPPTPPIPAPPKPVEKPPLTALASVDIGQKSGKPDAPETKPEPPPPPPPETQTAAVSPPPKPAPPSALTSALPKPTIPESAAELPEPAPPPPLLDLTPSQPAKPKQPVSMRAPPKHYRSTRDTEFDGPPATRNEYLAYCEALIVRHRGVVSDSFLAGRQGSLTLTLLVLGDGTISRITVARSSGYQDIDSRVEQMVSAVGRFPPLPQWFQGQAMPLMYHFAFPVRR